MHATIWAALVLDAWYGTSFFFLKGHFKKQTYTEPLNTRGKTPDVNLKFVASSLRDRIFHLLIIAGKFRVPIVSV